LDKDNALHQYIEKMEKWFWYDTITLLDCVLVDNENDPEYSANTVYSRLQCVVDFKKQYFGQYEDSVTELLLKNGYSEDDVKLLNKKRQQERQSDNQDNQGTVL
jgi:hypothetical protein